MRVLEFGRDPLFKAVDPEGASWVQVGEPLEPLTRFGGSVVAPDGWVRVLFGLLRRRFDFVVLPAIRVRAQGDADAFRRKAVRGILNRISSSRLLVRLVGRVLGLHRVPHVIRDVGDELEPGTTSLDLFPGAAAYAKRELAVGTQSHSAVPMMYSPMAFDAAYFPPLRAPGKETDVFFAGALISSERLVGREVLELLLEEGYKVDICDDPIPFEAYLRRMSQAWLALSPRGYGEHAYRHYEALMMGTVPVISRSDPPVHYDLQHGESALFYRGLDPDDLAMTIRDALADKAELRSIASAGAQLVEKVHDRESVARALLAAAGIRLP